MTTLDFVGQTRLGVMGHSMGNAVVCMAEASPQFGISAHTIQNFEAGKREPKISLAFKMADLYGCDVNEFRSEEEDEATV